MNGKFINKGVSFNVLMNGQVTKDDHEEMNIVYGAETGLIYFLAPLGNKPMMVKRINDYYDSMKVLSNYNADINFRLGLSNEFDNDPYKIDIAKGQKISGPQVDERILNTSGLPTNAKQRVFNSHNKWIREDLYRLDSKEIERHVVKQDIRTLLGYATRIKFGKYNVPCESLMIGRYAIPNNDKETLEKEYHKIDLQNEILKELNYWIPSPLDSFIDYDFIIKEKSKNVFE